MKAPMVDRRALGLVVFNIAHIVERMAVEKLAPERMRHSPRHATALANSGKHIFLFETKDVPVASTAVHLRAHTRVQACIAARRNRRQDSSVHKALGLPAVHPAFQVAKQPAKIAQRHPVQNDQK